MRPRSVANAAFAALALALLSACAPGGRPAAKVAGAPAALRLGSPFSSHMVIQRDSAAPIWGIDAPGTKVVVEAAGRKWKTSAGGDGKWKVAIGPFTPGEPFSIAVAGSRTEVLEDVVAGDVWLASGQSNMEFKLENEDGAEAVIAAADQPQIRLLTIPHNGTATPVDFVENPGWARCTPTTAAPFSAVAYHFGKEIQATQKVPVGLVLSSWGGATMESWTRLDAMTADPAFAWAAKEQSEWLDRAKKLEKEVAAYRAASTEWETLPPRKRLQDPGEGVMIPGWNRPDFDDSGWETVRVPDDVNLKVGNFDGVYCFRKSIDIPAEWQGKELLLSLGGIDDEDVTYLNGAEVGRTELKTTPSTGIHRRKYLIPAGAFQPGRNVIAIRNFDFQNVGGFRGPSNELWIAPAGSKASAIPLNTDWRVRVVYSERGKPSPVLPPERDVPALLYNGMIHPLQPMALRGVIWYQGESNADRAADYRHLSETMITDWRRQFGHGDFPFLYVQLAGYDINWPGWIQVMEAQQQTLTVPNTGMAVAADVGAEKDIHPKDKQTVGQRLALVGRAVAYGEKIVHSGPTLEKAVGAKHGAVELGFANVGGGLVLRPGIVGAFEIAGADGNFQPASAVVVDGKVVVSSPGITAPKAVRYAWRNFPTCQLYNREGLPAPPFRAEIGQ